MGGKRGSMGATMEEGGGEWEWDVVEKGEWCGSG